MLFKTPQQLHKEHNKRCPACKNAEVQSEPVDFDADGNFADRTGKTIKETKMIRVCSCGHRYQDDSFEYYRDNIMARY